MFGQVQGGTGRGRMGAECGSAGRNTGWGGRLRGGKGGVQAQSRAINCDRVVSSRPVIMPVRVHGRSPHLNKRHLTTN